MSERIASLARRVEDDPYFLAAALATYARAEALSDAQLAQRLGCTTAQLSAVRLCRKPRGSAREFQQDVERIAAAFQIDGTIIAEAVRLADSLQALGQVQVDAGFLMAARDRDTNETAGEAEEADES
jgi:transcriptional regulator with XRE-family HTH domain